MKNPTSHLGGCVAESENSSDGEDMRGMSGAWRPTVEVNLDSFGAEIRAGIVRAAFEMNWNLNQGTVSGKQVIHGVITGSSGLADLITGGLQCPGVCITGRAGNRDQDSARSDGPSVGPDMAEAGAMAGRHLLALNVSNMVFFGSGGDRESTQLKQSFLKACEIAGKPALAIDALPGEPSDRAAWLLRTVGSLPLPCAILADHDRHAVEIIAAAGHLGLRIPEDIAVLGVENCPRFQRRSPVPFSSVDLNLEQVGHTAARLLDRLMRGGICAQPTYSIRPKSLIARKSTAIYLCPVPGVTKAVLKIRNQYFKPITVSSMARECGMSVRNLHRLYRATTGNTIGQDIAARRMEVAAELLRDANLKLDPIAMETGLGNAKNLCRLFKETFGQTPGQWRASGHPRI